MRACVAVFGVVLISLLIVAGCTVEEREVAKVPITKTLTITWQRLVDDKGGTCDRCGLTEQEVGKAVAALKTSLGPLGIGVELDKRAIDAETCARDMSQSNRIWIGGQSLEDLLGAASGMSSCDSCCSMIGDAVECRTVVVDGKTYEAIPAELIVRAGLVAGSRLLGGGSAAPGAPCCGTAGGTSCGTGTSCDPGTSCGTGTSCSPGTSCDVGGK